MRFCPPRWGSLPGYNRFIALGGLCLLLLLQEAITFRTSFAPQVSTRRFSTVGPEANAERAWTPDMLSEGWTPPAGRIKGVLFDIDGTLFDSDPLHFEVFRDLLAKEGFNEGKPIDEEFFQSKIAGRSNAMICADLFPQWDAAKAEQWSANKEAAFRALAAGKLQATTGLEHVIKVIDELGLRKAAVTNAPRPNAEFMLNIIGRFNWFETVVIGDECERAKPDPMPYLVAMQRLGLEPHECVVVEDSPSGARAGVAAGAWTVGIPTSQPREVLSDAGCKLLIDDFTDARFLQVLKGESSVMM